MSILGSITIRVAVGVRARRTKQGGQPIETICCSITGLLLLWRRSMGGRLIWRIMPPLV